MLVVLGLIDVVMISNLLIMVIVGGYETFVSRMNLEGHPDQPEWLSHVNASVLKVKLATAIIGISSIHLLKTFINAAAYDEKTIIAQVGIHITFLLSAMAIAASDRIMPAAPRSTASTHDHHPQGGSRPEHRRRAAVHLLLPSGGLHPRARARLRARAVAGGQGRHRADPHQLAHVRRGPPPDLPGHRHRQRVPENRHEGALRF